MSIDLFSKQQFEDVLATINPHWTCRGIAYGEYEYLLPIDDEIGIVVRSSVNRFGWSADTGEDSIRAYLAERVLDEFINSGYDWMPLAGRANAVTRWTTRVSGWEKRLTELVATLTDWRKRAGNCCEVPKLILKSKTASNPGRVFAKCHVCGKGFMWLTEKGM